MTEQVFQSSLESDDVRATMNSMKSRTVVARFSENTGMYPLTSLLVGEVLQRVLPASEVVAMGCLRGNHEWHITLASPEAYDCLLATEKITVRTEQGTRSAYLQPLVPRQVFVRVLWAPAWVPPQAIFETLASIAPVEDFERCRVKLGGRAVHNLQYTASLVGVWPEKVPDRVTLQVMGERVPLLFLVRGKPRSCFLCGSLNHSQANCPNPTCRYCKEKGHVVLNCPRKTQPAPQRQDVTPVAVPVTEAAQAPRTEMSQPVPASVENPGTSDKAETVKRKHSGVSSEEPPASSAKRGVQPAEPPAVEPPAPPMAQPPAPLVVQPTAPPASPVIPETPVSADVVTVPESQKDILSETLDMSDAEEFFPTLTIVESGEDS